MPRFNRHSKHHKRKILTDIRSLIMIEDLLKAQIQDIIREDHLIIIKMREIIKILATIIKIIQISNSLINKALVRLKWLRLIPSLHHTKGNQIFK